MKQFNLWFTLSLIVVLAMTCASQLKPTSNIYTASIDTQTEHDTIKLSDIIDYTDRDGVMHFDTNKTKHLHGFTGDSIIHYYGYLFDVGEHNELRVKRVVYKERESFGNYTTYFYEIFHKGYPLNETVASFDVRNKQIFRAKHFWNPILDIDTLTAISPKEAQKNAIQDMPSEVKIWQVKPDKKIKKIEGSYKFVYAISIWSFAPMNHQEVLIDPKNGEVLANYSLQKY